MPRFFVEECLPADISQISLRHEDAHHATHVLRMREGDEVIVCDGARTDHITVIEGFAADAVFLKVIERRENTTEPKWQAWLYQGLPKGDKMDLVIQKAVELGVHAVVPVRCSRSVMKLAANKAERKLERWNRIALEAARQCGRGQVPKVYPPVDFDRAVEEMSRKQISFLPWENERAVSLRSYLEQKQTGSKESAPDIGFVIGPEGGFSPAEVLEAEKANIRTVTLGPRILRTETAGMAILAMLGYYFDQYE